MSETIADIVSEIRERFKPYARSDSNDARYTAYMGYAEFADRIEAAHKREIAALESDRDQWRKQALEEDARANAETQKPLRNCDVGTADKQVERFGVFCGKCSRTWCGHEEKALLLEKCALRWAQLPYTEGGAK